MVLTQLGLSLKEILKKLNQHQQINIIVVNQIIKEISLALLKADINVKLIQKVSENIKLKFIIHETEIINHQKLIQKSIIEELTLLFQNDIQSFVPKKGKPNVIIFIGLKGSGKISTCSKYAYYYQKRGWKVGIVNAETIYSSGLNQIKYNTMRIKVPFYGTDSELDPVQIACDGVMTFKKMGIELILIDIEGMYKYDNDLFEEMKQIESKIQPDNIILVIDSSFGQFCSNQAQTFKNTFNSGSIIITKLDCHEKGGGAISGIVSTNTSIDFICDGEQLDNLLEFQSKSYLIKLLGFEDIKKQIKKLENFISIGPKEKQFTLKDLELDINDIIRLGSINKFLCKIDVSTVNEQEQRNKFKKYIYIMNSMTSQELNGQVLLSNSRIKRIAIGSGTTIEQINDLLTLHKIYQQLKHYTPKDNYKELINKGLSQQQLENILKNDQKLGKFKNIQDMMKEIGNLKNNKINPM